MPSPQAAHRIRPSSDRGEPPLHPEHGLASQTREDQSAYYRDPPSAGYPLHSRSSRPDSRGHYYEHHQHDRSGSHRIRPTNSQPNEDVDRDFIREETRSSRDSSGGGTHFPASEPSHPPLDVRKRGRNDMDVDSDDAAEGDPVHFPGVRKHEDRGSKRYHREHVRSVDDPEDSRMGPS